MRPLMSHSCGGHDGPHHIYIMMKFFVLLVVTRTVALSAETLLIKKPPKLDVESTRTVWYQIPNSGTPNKFELKCQAIGDSIKYEWIKNGRDYVVDNERVVWQRSGQSGTIIFSKPEVSDQGFYQCKARNVFGIAASNIFEVKLGTLDHFPNRPVREISVKQGESLTLPCSSPYGFPKPTVFWLYRNTRQSFVIETIDRPHIMVDGEGALQFAYVEMHDGRENLVYQCAATSPVLHGEYRAGDEVYLTVENSSLVPTPPKLVWFSPKLVNVTAGDFLKLICIFSGYPAPTIIWSKKAGQLPKDRLSHENFGRTLVIRPVSHKDRGIYQCQAGNEKYDITVEVSSAPQWKNGPPEDFDLSEDDDVELRCQTTGDPKPVVKWYKNTEPIDLIDEGANRRNLLNQGEILKIASLQQKVDRAVYQCNASNPMGYVFSNVYVNVKAHAPMFLTAINQSLKTVVGSTVDLDCLVDAAPAATVRWLDIENNEILPIDGKREILANGSLRIHNVRSHDADTYFCDVVNKFGVNQAKRILDVYRPSFFVILLEPNERALESGDDLELTCKAESDERLKIEYLWHKDGRPINRDIVSEKFHARNQLKLNNLRGRDSGVYKCMAKTEVDEISTETKLVVKDVPDAPIITRIQCQDSQALISWTIPFDNNARISEYSIEYNTNFHPKKWRTGLVLKSRDNQQLYEASVNLSPWVTYAFRVAAANSHGWGLPGYMEHHNCRTPASFPHENPSNVSVFGTKKNNLIIQWQPLEDEAWNGPNLSYIIRYRLGDSVRNDWHEMIVSDPSQSEIEINGVPTYHKFRAQVISKNAMGIAIKEPETYFGYSGEDVPTNSPTNFRPDKLNATHVAFTWDPVNIHTVNGKLTGYTIKIWETVGLKKRLAGFLWEVAVGPDATYTFVDGFQPMHHYAANIIVSNSKYNSSPSEVVRFTTPEGPPGPVESLKAKAYGSHTILSTWSSPKQAYGNLTVYRIEYLEENDNLVANSIFDTAVLPNTHHHLHSILKPSTNYTIVVWAVTGGGQGPKSISRTRTFKKQAPGKPDFDIQSLDQTSVIVKWLPSQKGLPGTSFFVNYSKSASFDKYKDITRAWAKSPHVYLPDIYITIDGLTPDTKYQFVLYAIDEDLSTPSSIKPFRTLRKISQQYTAFREENIATAAWFIAIMSALCVFVLSTVTVCICKMRRGEKYPVKKKEMERGNHNVDHDEEKSFIEYQYGASSNGSTSGSVES